MIQLLTQMVYFRDTHGSFNLPEYAFLEQNEPISTLTTVICRKYAFQILSQFSQANNVLDAPASNSDVFMSRDTSVSST
jgi:hypothetical protein